MKTSKTNRATDYLLSALVLFAAVGLTWAGLSGAKEISVPVSSMKNVDTIKASDLPEDAVVIVVDAGHGGFDGGAVGSTTGVLESELNLEVAELLKDELLNRGCYVIMTREDENALADTKKEDMRRRRDIMRLDIVDIVVSVHMNKFSDSTVEGPMIFYMKNSAEGKALAECVMYSVCESLGRPQRFANPEDLFVLREPFAPSVLVECGFLSNPEDEKKLCDAEYRKRLAVAIADGIQDYISTASVNRDG